MSMSTDIKRALALYAQLTALLANAINTQVPEANIELPAGPPFDLFDVINSLRSKLHRIFEEQQPAIVVAKLWLVAGVPVGLDQLNGVIHDINDFKSDKFEARSQLQLLKEFMETTPADKLASDFRAHYQDVCRQISARKNNRARPARATYERIADGARRQLTDKQIADEEKKDVKYVKDALYTMRKEGTVIPHRGRGRKKNKAK